MYVQYIYMYKYNYTDALDKIYYIQQCIYI